MTEMGRTYVRVTVAWVASLVGLYALQLYFS
jgi:hypothetical protein